MTTREVPRHLLRVPSPIGRLEVHSDGGQLAALAWGSVTTYGALGRGEGRATARRAVGRAIGDDPMPILIPCHRVLGSDGRRRAYSAGKGIATKLALLELEGIVLATRAPTVTEIDVRAATVVPEPHAVSEPTA